MTELRSRPLFRIDVTLHPYLDVGATPLGITPFFETADPRYAWINHVVAVGMGDRRADGVVYDVFEIL